MRFTVTQNITLDGRIEMLDDWFDPTLQDEELTAAMREHSERESHLVLGRQTFEDFRGYWPKQADDTTGVAEHLNTVEKLVVTSSTDDLHWQNSRSVGSDPVATVRELRETPGDLAGATGSIRVVHALAEADVVDEYHLLVYPVWQGRGRGLFRDDLAAPKLRLKWTKAFESGVVWNAYDVTRRV
ncbi:dihydrofolate reductase family protein [Agrococcus casei]|uniref:dihydrofolate reductase family protein n=1 Tax=Agrococcus casei TaxID=343512 RepID=UPI003F8F60DF